MIRPLLNPQILGGWEESVSSDPGSGPPDYTASSGAFGILAGLHLDPYSAPAIRQAFAGDGVAELLFPALYHFLALSGDVQGDRRAFLAIARHWLSVTYNALPVGPTHSAIPMQVHMQFAAERQRMIDQCTVTDLCYEALCAW